VTQRGIALGGPGLAGGLDGRRQRQPKVAEATPQPTSAGRPHLVPVCPTFAVVGGSLHHHQRALLDEPMEVDIIRMQSLDQFKRLRQNG
jgi:hypothetical protein